jgi:ribonucleases P/MRP protein subunit RPP40
MLEFLGEKNGRPDSKVFTTLGSLPSYIDRNQPPTKKMPWKAINEVGFVKSVDLILPEELCELMWRKVEDQSKTVQYAEVVMKLEDLLNGAFFTEYIKKGKQM